MTNSIEKNQDLQIDGFAVEEIIREALELGDSNPEIIEFEYNDLVEYTKFIMEECMKSVLENYEKQLIEKFGITDEDRKKFN